MRPVLVVNTFLDVFIRDFRTKKGLRPIDIVVWQQQKPSKQSVGICFEGFLT